VVDFVVDLTTGFVATGFVVDLTTGFMVDSFMVDTTDFVAVDGAILSRTLMACQRFCETNVTAPPH
jgi:hypothetical protein